MRLTIALTVVAVGLSVGQIADAVELQLAQDAHHAVVTQGSAPEEDCDCVSLTAAESDECIECESCLCNSRYASWTENLILRAKLPSALHSTGDMPPHLPYIAQPKFYYYFRPYNFRRIPLQVAEAAQYGSDPRNPYSARKLFDDIYEQFERESVEANAPEPLSVRSSGVRSVRRVISVQPEPDSSQR